LDTIVTYCNLKNIVFFILQPFRNTTYFCLVNISSIIKGLHEIVPYREQSYYLRISTDIVEILLIM